MKDKLIYFKTYAHILLMSSALSLTSRENSVNATDIAEIESPIKHKSSFKISFKNEKLKVYSNNLIGHNNSIHRIQSLLTIASPFRSMKIRFSIYKTALNKFISKNKFYYQGALIRKITALHRLSLLQFTIKATAQPNLRIRTFEPSHTMSTIYKMMNSSLIHMSYPSLR